jgi:putative transposase
MRFAAIARHRDLWPLRWWCEALQVTPSGFHAWLKRPECERKQKDRVLSGLVRESFADSDKTYGARRVRRDLRAWGHRCGIHRTQRLMSAQGLIARPRRIGNSTDLPRPSRLMDRALWRARMGPSPPSLAPAP